MDLLIFLLTGGCAPALLVGLILGGCAVRSGLRARSAAALATELGLRATGGTIEGALDDRALSIRPESRGSGKRRRTVQVLRVRVPELPPGLRLTATPALALGASGPDRTLGDEAFDRAFRVDIEDGHVAWLDAEAREGLRWARVHALGDGVLQVEQDHVFTPLYVREVVALANRLARRDRAEALHRIAVGDPAPRVQVLALEVLTREVPGADTSLLLLDLARSADAPLVRAAATALAGRVDELARLVGALTPPDLHALAGLLERRGTAEQVAAALTGLPGAIPRPVWFTVTAAAAAHPDEAVARAVDAAAARLARGDDEAFVADRALHALLAATDAQPLVLRWLGRADRAVPEALAWLGAHGTVDAVPALNALIADTWPLGETRTAAEGAKAAIQARAGGHRGDLSLAAPDARGALSEGAATQGRLAEARRVPEG
jgi:hypothetical protein